MPSSASGGEGDRSPDVHGKDAARAIRELEGFCKGRFGLRRLPDRLEDFRVHHRRSLPVGEHLLDFGRKKQRERPAFRPEPQTLLAAEDVDVFRKSGALGFRLDAGGDDFRIDPTEGGTLRPRRCGGHHAALVSRGDGDPRASRGKLDDFRMFLQECQVLFIGGCREGDAGSEGDDG